MDFLLVGALAFWILVGSVVVLRAEARLLGIRIRDLGRTPSQDGIFLKRSSGAMAWILLWPAVPFLARLWQRP